MIKAFLFDIGNVIVDFDFDRAAQKLRGLCCHPTDPIEAIVDLRHELELGSMTGEEFTQAAIKRIGFVGSHDEFVSIYQDIFTPNHPMWDLIERLAEHHPLFLLSNTSDLHHAGLLRDYPIFKAFRGGIYSYIAKSAKPDPQIFATALHELPLVAETTLYLDDLSANVAAGKSHGLLSYQYNSMAHDDCLSFLAGMQFKLS